MELLPDPRAGMDADTTSEAPKPRKLLERFAKGGGDILLGRRCRKGLDLQCHAVSACSTQTCRSTAGDYPRAGGHFSC